MTRRNYHCHVCARSTKSPTRYCRDHRPADAIPEVSLMPNGMVTFGGLTLTQDQARRLVDTVHDVLEKKAGHHV